MEEEDTIPDVIRYVPDEALRVACLAMYRSGSDTDKTKAVMQCLNYEKSLKARADAARRRMLLGHYTRAREKFYSNS